MSSMTEIDINVKIQDFLRSALQKIFVNDYHKAINELKAAEVIDKNNPEILYNLGISYCRLGLHKTALNYFDRLFLLPFAFIEILTVKKLYAYCLIHLKEFLTALKYIDEVLQISPAHTAAANMKGYSLEKLGKSLEAIELYRLIIKRDDKNYNAYNSLAYLLAQHTKNFTIALEYAQKAVSGSTKNPAYLDTLGYVYEHLGDYKQAEHFVKIALAYAPMSEEIRSHLKSIINKK